MGILSEEDFRKLTLYIKNKFGIHLGREKKTLVEGRLHKVLLSLGIDNANDYYQYLLQDKTGQADKFLANAITTNHTFFMRESQHFEYFSEEVLPYFSEKLSDNDLRTWCAACSTGEEAYTLAMIIQDFFSLQKQSWDTKLLATDLSTSALNDARLGIYNDESIDMLPKRWRKIYFKQINENNFQVKNFLKNEIIFRQFNLNNPQFLFKKKFHIIFCRNVMIYFDRVTRKELVNKFYQWLEPGGYLFIGHSEVIERGDFSFQYVMPAVYRKGL